MRLSDEALPPPPSRPADLDDDFSSGTLDRSRWITAYLPHWTTADRSQARWNSEVDGIRLRIDRDQLGWRPEDAPLRVSNLQTANFSGPTGSPRGMHRHRTHLAVRTETRRGFTSPHGPVAWTSRSRPPETPAAWSPRGS